MSDEAMRQVRADRAQQTLAEIAEAMNAIRAGLTDNLVKAAKQGRQDRATDLIGMSLKCLDNLEGYFAAVIADGEVARHAAEAVSDLSRLRVEQRRYAAY